METVNVTIKYLVNFYEKTGKKLDEVTFPLGADLHSAAAWLKEQYGLIVPAKGVLNLLNGHGWNQYPEGMDKKLCDGDTIILMPSISGG